MHSNQVSRRDALKAGVVGSRATIGLPTFIPASAFGANDRIRVAVIGINGRGKDHIQGIQKQKDV